jgi:hypothetical protein
MKIELWPRQGRRFLSAKRTFRRRPFVLSGFIKIKGLVIIDAEAGIEPNPKR